jgi:hypothetical protein
MKKPLNHTTAYLAPSLDLTSERRISSFPSLSGALQGEGSGRLLWQGVSS